MQAINELAKRADQRHPGWYQNIDTDTLQMSMERKCVVGQWFLNTGELEPEEYSYIKELKNLFGLRPTDRIEEMTVSNLLSNNVEQWKEEIVSRQETDAILNDEDAMSAINRNREEIGALVTTS